MSKYRKRDYSDDDYGSPNTFGNSLGDYFGSYPDDKMSASLEQAYMHDKSTPSPTMCDFLEQQSPLFQKRTLEEEEKLLSECVEFLKSNGGDLEKDSQLEKIARRNDFDCEKSLMDFQSFLFGENSPVKPAYGQEIFDGGNDVDDQNKKINQKKKKRGKKKKKKKKKMLSMEQFMRNQQQDSFSERIPTPMPQGRKIKPNIFMIERPDHLKKMKKMMKTKVKKKMESGREPDVLEKGKKEKSGKEIVNQQKSFAKKKVEKDTEKTRLNIVIIGHVDAGKSTMMGRLLLDSGNVSQQKIHKFEKESKEIGKSSFYLAWVLDEQSDERAHGVTIDIGVKHFSTSNKVITILDAPGHKDFVPNMIMGAAQADVAVLVVDAITGAFESGFCDRGQTREHLIVARSLGIKQMVVAVNKMDVCDYSEERYLEIREKVQSYVRTLGFKDNLVDFIPVSGLTGENLVTRNSKSMDWYTGRTLIGYMDDMKKMKRSVDSPLRICVADAYKNDHVGVCVAGTLDSGSLSRREKILMMPVREVATVKNIYRNGLIVDTAYAGDNVEIAIKNIDFVSLRVGQIICDPQAPIDYCRRFQATIITFHLSVPIIKGAQVIVHLQNNKSPAVFKKLISVLDKKRKGVKKKRPRFLKKNMTAVCEILLETPLGMELYEKNRVYGRVIIRRSGNTIGSGIITKMFSD